jgi:uncharacterized damage-inducible protein DinB
MQKFYEALLDRFQDLHREILKSLEDLPAEALDWKPGLETNSLTVLIVHLSGAERYWIGDVVKGDSSQRDRNAEFEARGLDREVLKQRIKELDVYEKAIFEEMGLGELEEERVSARDGRKYSVAWALSHALEHTALHVGHIQTLGQLWKERIQSR